MEKFNDILKNIGIVTLLVVVAVAAFAGWQRHHYRAAYDLMDGKWCKVDESCVAVSHYLVMDDFDSQEDRRTVVTNFFPAGKWDALSQTDKYYVQDKISDDYHFTSGWKTDKVEVARGTWKDYGRVASR